MLILGCGYLGTALARAALAEGEAVSALTRSAARAAGLRALGLNPVLAADIAGDDWHAALNPAGAVIVNSVAPASRGAEGYRHSFVEGAKSIMRWLEHSAATGHAPARELIFTSSTSVYPQTDGGWVAEDAPVDAVEPGPAGMVLRETENLLLALPSRLVQRVWILRLAGLYGPGRHHLLDALRAGEKTFPGDGAHWVNLLHRDDAVRAMRACGAAPPALRGGLYNVADDEPVRKSELVAWLAGKLGQDAAALSFDAATRARSPHRRNAAGKVPHRRVSNTRLKNTFGWTPLYPSYRDGYDEIMGQMIPKPM
jgi:nucleoside-diphosphate-sugar epimerase